MHQSLNADLAPQGIPVLVGGVFCRQSPMVTHASWVTCSSPFHISRAAILDADVAMTFQARWLRTVHAARRDHGVDWLLVSLKSRGGAR